MVPARIMAILALGVALASSAVVTTFHDVTTRKEPVEYWTAATRETPTLNFTEKNDDDGKIEGGEIDGIPLNYLTLYEIQELVNCEDRILAAELDILVAKKFVLKRVRTRPHHENHKSLGNRKKRFAVPLLRGLLTAGRNLFKGAVKSSEPTVSGDRVTQQYIKPGGYEDAVKHFDSFNPENVKTFTTEQGISGETGTVGQHRFTVRDGSKQGSPTLEIRTPKEEGEFVRKFRFEE